MSKNVKQSARFESTIIEVKSKFEAEFRRFSMHRSRPADFEQFYGLLEKLHGLYHVIFVITYTSFEGDQLPINNSDNLSFALTSTRSLLRLFLQLKGNNILELTGYGTTSHQRNNNRLCQILKSDCQSSSSDPIPIVGPPSNFHHVSSIIDVDIIPPTQRRVKLMRAINDDRALGFFIRDGYNLRQTQHGLEHCPGIFISRLIPGGLAAGTGLLAVNDEVLEVNGIEVDGKTLDQVTDMMIANGRNLILTICPVNQCNNVTSRRYRKQSARSRDQRPAEPVVDVNTDEDNDTDEIVQVERLPSSGRYTNTDSSGDSSQFVRSSNINDTTDSWNRRILRI